MKTAVISLAIAAFIFLFSFQNCQNSPHPDEFGGLALNAVASTDNVDLSQESLKSVNFILPDSRTVTKASNTYTIKYNITLNIVLNTGVIVEANDLDSGTVNYCLSESLKDELVAILKSSRICQTQPNLPAGTLCAQALKPPYVQVFTANEQYDLGSATDGCGNNSIDLCEDQSDLLKGFIENVRKQYKQWACVL